MARITFGQFVFTFLSFENSKRHFSDYHLNSRLKTIKFQNRNAAILHFAMNRSFGINRTTGNKYRPTFEMTDFFRSNTLLRPLPYRYISIHVSTRRRRGEGREKKSLFTTTTEKTDLVINKCRILHFSSVRSGSPRFAFRRIELFCKSNPRPSCNRVIESVALIANADSLSVGPL